MASNRTWELVKPFFKKDSKLDNWGDPDAIDDLHLLRLFDFRTYINCPIFVTSGIRMPGTGEKSYHVPRKMPSGKEVGFATDVVIPHYDDSTFDLILDATRFFNGVGYYPHWRWKGQVVGGLHLDSRPLGYDKDGTLNYREARWMGVLRADGKQDYIPMTFENIMKAAKFPKLDDGNSH